MSKRLALRPETGRSGEGLALSPEEREAARLDALEHFDILDSPSEEAFDRITRLARKQFDVPTSIVSFIDGHRQWYKSCKGTNTSEVPRGDSFCRYVMAYGGPLVVPNATHDPRFAQNPYVRTDPGVRFYAGFPLRTNDGHTLGTLCLVDVKPREFDPDHLELMSDLAHIVMD
jgi:GAF domain-containing protein